jgi:hypothetical protein
MYRLNNIDANNHVRATAAGKKPFTVFVIGSNKTLWFFKDHPPFVSFRSHAQQMTASRPSGRNVLGAALVTKGSRTKPLRGIGACR